LGRRSLTTGTQRNTEQKHLTTKDTKEHEGEAHSNQNSALPKHLRLKLNAKS